MREKGVGRFLANGPSFLALDKSKGAGIKQCPAVRNWSGQLQAVAADLNQLGRERRGEAMGDKKGEGTRRALSGDRAREQPVHCEIEVGMAFLACNTNRVSTQKLRTKLGPGFYPYSASKRRAGNEERKDEESTPAFVGMKP